MAYERLMMEYPQLHIMEKLLPKGLSGLYYNNVIEINKYKTKYEKHCILAEELGHHETTYGDITDLDDITSRKLELVARRWGYEKIVSLDKLIECYVEGYTTVEDMCEHLEIVPDYLCKAVEVYNQRYGLSTIKNNFRIFFDPLNIKPILNTEKEPNA